MRIQLEIMPRFLVRLKWFKPNSSRLSDLYLSPETLEDIRNWSLISTLPQSDENEFSMSKMLRMAGLDKPVFSDQRIIIHQTF